MASGGHTLRADIGFCMLGIIELWALLESFYARSISFWLTNVTDGASCPVFLHLGPRALCQDEDTLDFPFGRARACSDSCLFDSTTPKAPEEEAQHYSCSLYMGCELCQGGCRLMLSWNTLGRRIQAGRVLFHHLLKASRADLNVSIELTGASCLNTPRSEPWHSFRAVHGLSIK